MDLAEFLFYPVDLKQIFQQNVVILLLRRLCGDFRTRLIVGHLQLIESLKDGKFS